MQSVEVLVLLVEDEALVAMPIEQSLHDGGFATVLVHDGRRAIDELEKEASRFKAVITDIRLGQGPDGWEVAHHARHLVPDIAVIYISGDSKSAWTEKGVPKSVMLEKPFAMS
jgi:CheY-like chemotaxis protein